MKTGQRSLTIVIEDDPLRYFLLANDEIVALHATIAPANDPRCTRRG